MPLKSESLLVMCSDTVHASCTLGGNVRWHACSFQSVNQWRNLSCTPILKSISLSVMPHLRGETILVRSLAPAFLINDEHAVQSRGTKSSVDDLGTGRCVVLSRAAPTLRSIETHPTTGRSVHTRQAFRKFQVELDNHLTIAFL